MKSIIIEVKKVLIRKDGVKMVVIPKRSKINAGDLVIISNDPELLTELKRKEERK